MSDHEEGKKPPDFRWRIFLSADIVGSTRFKTESEHNSYGADRAPKWVKTILAFYQQFSKEMNKRYEQRAKDRGLCEEIYACPKLWKTVGDELIFVGRINDETHLAVCLLSFLDAMKDYRRILSTTSLKLNLKANCWVAGFPAPNYTIPKPDIGLSATEEMTTTEDLEKQADEDPSRFDFLGPQVDAGFRMARNSSADRCSLSLDLAALVVRRQRNAPNIIDREFEFEYLGREVFKGVMQESPYPVISVATVYDRSQAYLIEAEKRLKPRVECNPNDLDEFIKAFFASQNIRRPSIAEKMGEEFQPPVEYEEFIRAFSDGIVDEEKQSESQLLGMSHQDATDGNNDPVTEESQPSLEDLDLSSEED